MWERSHQFTLAIYRTTQGFPQDERYGLTSQMRRAAASHPSNITEGCGRQGDVELARFMQIAMGSASESEYQLLLAHDLGLFATDAYQPLEQELVEVKRMMNAFLQKLRQSERLIAKC